MKNKLIQFLERMDVKTNILIEISKTIVPIDFNHEGGRFLIGGYYANILVKLYPNYDSEEGGFIIHETKGHDLLFKYKNESPIKVSVKTQRNLFKGQNGMTKEVAQKNTMLKNGISINSFFSFGDKYSFYQKITSIESNKRKNEEWDVCIYISRPYHPTEEKCTPEIGVASLDKDTYNFLHKIETTSGQIKVKIPLLKFGNTLIKKEILPISDNHRKKLSDCYAENQKNLFEKIENINQEFYHTKCN